METTLLISTRNQPEPGSPKSIFTTDGHGLARMSGREFRELSLIAEWELIHDNSCNSRHISSTDPYASVSIRGCTFLMPPLSWLKPGANERSHQRNLARERGGWCPPFRMPN